MMMDADDVHMAVNFYIDQRHGYAHHIHLVRRPVGRATIVVPCCMHACTDRREPDFVSFTICLAAFTTALGVDM
jgi:hypothetical protein